MSRFFVAAVVTSSICYGLITIWLMATSPELGFVARLNPLSPQPDGVSGVAIVRLYDEPEDSALPQTGDWLCELNGRPIRTFYDFATELANLRSEELHLYSDLSGGGAPDAVPRSSTFTLGQRDGRQEVRIWYRSSANLEELRSAWIPLRRQSLSTLVLPVVWFASQLMIMVTCGVAYWNQSNDRTLRVFLILCCAALVAYVGASRWWLISGMVVLAVPFIFAATLLPALLLHFLLLYPRPHRWIEQYPRTMLTAIYAIPGSFSALFIGLSTLGWLFTSTSKSGLALPEAFFDVQHSIGQWSAAQINTLVLIYICLAAIYFVTGLTVLVLQARQGRTFHERSQYRWMIWAGATSMVFLSISLFLTFRDPLGLPMGKIRWPMFLAGFAFIPAYALGIVRDRLIIVEQTLGLGVRYYAINAVSLLAFSIAVVTTSLLAIQQETVFGDPIVLAIMMTLTVIVLGWMRDRLQRMIDRHFFRDKYPLDRAMQRMNRAVARLGDRKLLGDQMLASCCDVLGVERAAIYFRQPEGEQFQLLCSAGSPRFVKQFDASEEFVESLRMGLSVQRIRSSDTSAQKLIRLLDVVLVQPLELEGEIDAVVVLGRKVNGAAFSAEDVTFLTALGRVSGVSLHFAKLHEDFARLNVDLKDKADRIDAQAQQIALLERQLALRAEEQLVRDEGAFAAGHIVARSPAMMQVLDTVRKVAPSQSSVLIRGESGTGKELLAKAIHQNSPRADGPLVTVHCAALSATLLESELFGHVKGAFTDARQDKPGRFALADGGTLFLDEIGDVPLEMQVKLLRVLQERTFEPVGSNQTIRVDVRVIAATHRPLEKLIAEGKFREDLYYRLNVITITLPPLRERADDLLPLAMHFLDQAARKSGKAVTHFEERALQTLLEYSWPGNIRELENTIERAVVLAESDRLRYDDLPVAVRRPAAGNVLAHRLPLTLRTNSLPHLTATDHIANGSDAADEEERVELLSALERCHGNKAEAARLLGMPRSTYYSKLKKFGLA